MRALPEQQIQMACVDFTSFCCPNVLLSASQNGLYIGNGKNAAAYIARQKKLGMLPGELDLMLTWAPKNILFVELKSQGGRLTKTQEIVIATRNAQGFDCVVALSLDQYVAYLRQYRVPMRPCFYAGIGRIP